MLRRLNTPKHSGGYPVLEAISASPRIGLIMPTDLMKEIVRTFAYKCTKANRQVCIINKTAKQKQGEKV